MSVFENESSSFKETILYMADCSSQYYGDICSSPLQPSAPWSAFAGFDVVADSQGSVVFEGDLKTTALFKNAKSNVFSDTPIMGDMHLVHDQKVRTSWICTLSGSCQCAIGVVPEEFVVSNTSFFDTGLIGCVDLMATGGSRDLVRCNLINKLVEIEVDSINFTVSLFLNGTLEHCFPVPASCFPLRLVFSGGVGSKIKLLHSDLDTLCGNGSTKESTEPSMVEPPSDKESINYILINAKRTIDDRLQSRAEYKRCLEFSKKISYASKFLISSVENVSARSGSGRGSAEVWRNSHFIEPDFEYRDPSVDDIQLAATISLTMQSLILLEDTGEYLKTVKNLIRTLSLLLGQSGIVYSLQRHVPSVCRWMQGSLANSAMEFSNGCTRVRRILTDAPVNIVKAILPANICKFAIQLQESGENLVGFSFGICKRELEKLSLFGDGESWGLCVNAASLPNANISCSGTVSKSQVAIKVDDVFCLSVNIPEKWAELSINGEILSKFDLPEGDPSSFYFGATLPASSCIEVIPSCAAPPLSYRQIAFHHLKFKSSNLIGGQIDIFVALSKRLLQSHSTDEEFADIMVSFLFSVAVVRKNFEALMEVVNELCLGRRILPACLPLLMGLGSVQHNQAEEDEPPVVTTKSKRFQAKTPHKKRHQSKKSILSTEGEVDAAVECEGDVVVGSEQCLYLVKSLSGLYLSTQFAPESIDQGLGDIGTLLDLIQRVEKGKYTSMTPEWTVSMWTSLLALLSRILHSLREKHPNFSLSRMYQSAIVEAIEASVFSVQVDGSIASKAFECLSAHVRLIFREKSDFFSYFKNLLNPENPTSKAFCAIELLSCLPKSEIIELLDPPKSESMESVPQSAAILTGLTLDVGTKLFEEHLAQLTSLSPQVPHVANVVRRHLTATRAIELQSKLALGLNYCKLPKVATVELKEEYFEAMDNILDLSLVLVQKSSRCLEHVFGSLSKLQAIDKFRYYQIGHFLSSSFIHSCLLNGLNFSKICVCEFKMFVQSSKLLDLIKASLVLERQLSRIMTDFLPLERSLSCVITVYNTLSSSLAAFCEFGVNRISLGAPLFLDGMENSMFIPRSESLSIREESLSQFLQSLLTSDPSHHCDVAKRLLATASLLNSDFENSLVKISFLSAAFISLIVFNSLESDEAARDVDIYLANPTNENLADSVQRILRSALSSVSPFCVNKELDVSKISGTDFFRRALLLFRFNCSVDMKSDLSRRQKVLKFSKTFIFDFSLPFSRTELQVQNVVQSFELRTEILTLLSHLSTYPDANQIVDTFDLVILSVINAIYRSQGESDVLLSLHTGLTGLSKEKQSSLVSLGVTAAVNVAKRGIRLLELLSSSPAEDNKDYFSAISCCALLGQSYSFDEISNPQFMHLVDFLSSCIMSEDAILKAYSLEVSKALLESCCLSLRNQVQGESQALKDIYCKILETVFRVVGDSVNLVNPFLCASSPSLLSPASEVYAFELPQSSRLSSKFSSSSQSLSFRPMKVDSNHGFRFPMESLRNFHSFSSWVYLVPGGDCGGLIFSKGKPRTAVKRFTIESVRAIHDGKTLYSSGENVLVWSEVKQSWLKGTVQESKNFDDTTIILNGSVSTLNGVNWVNLRPLFSAGQAQPDSVSALFSIGGKVEVDYNGDGNWLPGIVSSQLTEKELFFEIEFSDSSLNKIALWSRIRFGLTAQRNMELIVDNDIKSVPFQFVSANTVPVGSWSHVAYCFDLSSKSAIFFLNGAEIGRKDLPVLMCNPNPPVVRTSRSIESAHNYADNSDIYWPISIPNAEKVSIRFDNRSTTEARCDYIQFFRGINVRQDFFGEKYSGSKFPGANGEPPLEIINVTDFEIYFHSDASQNAWGFKIDIVATEFDPSVSAVAYELSDQSPVLLGKYIEDSVTLSNCYICGSTFHSSSLLPADVRDLAIETATCMGYKPLDLLKAVGFAQPPTITKKKNPPPRLTVEDADESERDESAALEKFVIEKFSPDVGLQKIEVESTVSSTKMKVVIAKEGEEFSRPKQSHPSRAAREDSASPPPSTMQKDKSRSKFASEGEGRLNDFEYGEERSRRSSSDLSPRSSVEYSGDGGHGEGKGFKFLSPSVSTKSLGNVFGQGVSSTTNSRRPSKEFSVAEIDAMNKGLKDKAVQYLESQDNDENLDTVCEDSSASSIVDFIMLSEYLVDLFIVITRALSILPSGMSFASSLSVLFTEDIMEHALRLASMSLSFSLQISASKFLEMCFKVLSFEPVYKRMLKVSYLGTEAETFGLFGAGIRLLGSLNNPAVGEVSRRVSSERCRHNSEVLMCIMDGALACLGEVDVERTFSLLLTEFSSALNSSIQAVNGQTSCSESNLAQCIGFFVFCGSSLSTSSNLKQRISKWPLKTIKSHSNFLSSLHSLLTVSLPASTSCLALPFNSTKVIESIHPYENNMDVKWKLSFPGATSILITFDPECKTEAGCDYVQFYSDSSLKLRYGLEKYNGKGATNWPNVLIPSDSCIVRFYSDGSNVDWGFRLTATAATNQFVIPEPGDTDAAFVVSLWMLSMGKRVVNELHLLGALDDCLGAMSESAAQVFASNLLQKSAIFDSFERSYLSLPSESSGGPALEESQDSSVSTSGPPPVNEVRAEPEFPPRLFGAAIAYGSLITQYWERFVSTSSSSIETGVPTAPSLVLQASGENVMLVGNIVDSETTSGVDVKENAIAPFQNTLRTSLEKLILGKTESSKEISVGENYMEILTAFWTNSNFALTRILSELLKEDILFANFQFLCTSLLRVRETSVELSPNIVYFLLRMLFANEISRFVFSKVSSVEMRELCSSCIVRSISSNDGLDKWLALVGSNLASFEDYLMPEMPEMQYVAPVVIESAHNYTDNEDWEKPCVLEGATRMVFTFDPRTSTEKTHDHVTFKDAAGIVLAGPFSGKTGWPGVGTNEPVEVDGNSCRVVFHSDGSNVDWGFLVTISAARPAELPFKPTKRSLHDQIHSPSLQTGLFIFNLIVNRALESPIVASSLLIKICSSDLTLRSLRGLSSCLKSLQVQDFEVAIKIFASLISMMTRFIASEPPNISSMSSGIYCIAQISLEIEKFTRLTVFDSCGPESFYVSFFGQLSFSVQRYLSFFDLEQPNIGIDEGVLTSIRDVIAFVRGSYLPEPESVSTEEPPPAPVIPQVTVRTVQCGQHHDMVKFTSRPPEYYGTASCDLCRASIDYSGFYHCTPCGFDKCSSCADKTAILPPESATSPGDSTDAKVEEEAFTSISAESSAVSVFKLSNRDERQIGESKLFVSRLFSRISVNDSCVVGLLRRPDSDCAQGNISGNLGTLAGSFSWNNSGQVQITGISGVTEIHETGVTFSKGDVVGFVILLKGDKSLHTVQFVKNGCSVTKILFGVVLESAHPYDANTALSIPVERKEANGFTVVFDSKTSTEKRYDFVCFGKDFTRSFAWGREAYSGTSGDRVFPGLDAEPPLEVTSNRFILYFNSDGSNNDWGFKLTAQPLVGLHDVASLRPLNRIQPRRGHIVTRGPTWLWSDQDGQGPGVVVKEVENDWVTVLWWADSTVNVYRWNPLAGLFDVIVVRRHTNSLGTPMSLADDGLFRCLTCVESAQCTECLAASTRLRGCCDEYLRPVVQVSPQGEEPVDNPCDSIEAPEQAAPSSDGPQTVSTQEPDDKSSAVPESANADMTKRFIPGEKVTVVKNETASTLQSGFGGWVAEMSSHLGKDGVVVDVVSPGVVIVKMDSNGMLLSWNQELIQKKVKKSVESSSLGPVPSCGLAHQMVKLNAIPAEYDCTIVSCSVSCDDCKRPELELSDYFHCEACAFDLCLDCGQKLLSKDFESVHPYEHNVRQYVTVALPNWTGYLVTFDPQTSTENNCDYVKFFKDDSHTEEWGETKYSGGLNGSDKNFPGLKLPPLRIPAPSFVYYFYTDGSVNDWGYKFTVTPLPPEETVTQSPLAKSTVRCKNQHKTYFKTAKPPSYSGRCYCDLCRSTISNFSDGFFHCPFCKFDVCNTCAAPTAIPEKTVFLRIECEGIQLRIRPNANTEEAEVGYFQHGDVVEVFNEQQGGFYRLVDRRGFLMSTASGVRYVAVSGPDGQPADASAVSADAGTVEAEVSAGEPKSTPPAFSGLALSTFTASTPNELIASSTSIRTLISAPVLVDDIQDTSLYFGIESSAGSSLIFQPRPVFPTLPDSSSTPESTVVSATKISSRLPKAFRILGEIFESIQQLLRPTSSLMKREILDIFAPICQIRRTQVVNLTVESSITEISIPFATSYIIEPHPHNWNSAVQVEVSSRDSASSETRVVRFPRQDVDMTSFGVDNLADLYSKITSRHRLDVTDVGFGSVEFLIVGDYVVRGPDWRYSEEDGGPGCLGLVTAVYSAPPLTTNRHVAVRWLQSGTVGVYAVDQRAVRHWHERLSSCAPIETTKPWASIMASVSVVQLSDGSISTSHLNLNEDRRIKCDEIFNLESTSTVSSGNYFEIEVADLPKSASAFLIGFEVEGSDVEGNKSIEFACTVNAVGDVFGCGFDARNEVFLTINGIRTKNSSKIPSQWKAVRPLVVFTSSCNDQRVFINLGSRPFLYQSEGIFVNETVQAKLTSIFAEVMFFSRIDNIISAPTLNISLTPAPTVSPTTDSQSVQMRVIPFFGNAADMYSSEDFQTEASLCEKLCQVEELRSPTLLANLIACADHCIRISTDRTKTDSVSQDITDASLSAALQWSNLSTQAHLFQELVTFFESWKVSALSMGLLAAGTFSIADCFPLRSRVEQIKAFNKSMLASISRLNLNQDVIESDTCEHAILTYSLPFMLNSVRAHLIGSLLKAVSLPANNDFDSETWTKFASTVGVTVNENSAYFARFKVIEVAKVRRGPELSTQEVTELPVGTVIEAVAVQVNSNGVKRQKLADGRGWVSLTDATNPSRYFLQRLPIKLSENPLWNSVETFVSPVLALDDVAGGGLGIRPDFASCDGSNRSLQLLGELIGFALRTKSELPINLSPSFFNSIFGLTAETAATSDEGIAAVRKGMEAFLDKGILRLLSGEAFKLLTK